MASNNNPYGGPQNFNSELQACLKWAEELQAKNRAGARNLAELEAARNNISRLLTLIQMQNRVTSPAEENNGNFSHSSSSAECYESLWSEKEEDLYENTGPGSVLMAKASHIAAARSIEDNDDSPPPLPPRAPVRGSTPKSFSSTTNSSSRSTSAASLRPSSAAGHTTARPTALSSAGPSTAGLAPHSSIAIDDRIQKLRAERERLIQSLLDESNVKDLYYAELEVITQSIRRIPLPSAQSYSLDNEAERQKLELRAQRVQQEMEQKLGTSAESLQRREERYQAIKHLEQDIEALNEAKRTGFEGRTGFEARTMTENDHVTSRRTLGMHPGPGRQHQIPRSANLEMLYHESLPMDKALSHSGPPIFGNAPLRQDDTSSVISFTSSIHSLNDASMATNRRREDIDTKIEFGNSLMELFGSNDAEKLSRTFLAMSSSPANCDNMRSSRIIPILIHLLHGDCGPIGESGPNQRPSREVRLRVARALHNIVHAHPTDKQCKREARVLRLLETLRLYSDYLRDYILAAASGQLESSDTGCSPVCIRLIPGGHPATRKDLLVCEVRRKSSPSGSLSRRSSRRDPHHDSIDEEIDGQNSVQFSLPCHHFVNYSSDSLLGGEGDGQGDPEQVIQLNIEETMAVLTRCSFDEYLRQPIFLLGGIRAIAELIQVEREAHCHLGCQGQDDVSNSGSQVRNPCTDVRRYAVVALTNLTFGNANIKSFLCSFPGFIPIMVQQLESPFDTLRKATAHLFRNLAWKADKNSKQILSESNVVAVLMNAAMQVWIRSGMDGISKEEPTLKVVLSALWNLSAHCRKNKDDICAMDGALSFLVNLLRYQATSIVENGGGILRNISSFIATSPDGERYRAILRENACLEILLHQLKSTSLTIVSNACGTLWNLSARCVEDQRALWDLGAVPMLQSLTNSKHSTISTCSLGALKNLYSARPMATVGSSPEEIGGLPSLQARKLKNLAKDLDAKLQTDPGDHAEEDPDSSDLDSESDGAAMRRSGTNGVDASMASRNTSRCESHDSLTSTHSDMVLMHPNNIAIRNLQHHQQQQQQQRGGSLDRGQQQLHDEVDLNLGRHRRPLPLPLSARHGQPSFLRPRAANVPGHDGDGRMSAENQHYAQKFNYENHFQNFQHYPPQPQANNYVYPVENGFGFNNTAMTNGRSFVGPDNNVLADLDEQPSFGNNHSNDADEDLDEKPTDYSLRFQESEEPEYMSANVPPQAGNPSTPPPVRAPVDPDDEDDDLCVDAVKSYFIEATPFDTPGPISEATSVNDLRNISDPPQIHHDEDDDELYETRQGGGDRPKLYCTEDTPGVFSRVDSLSSLGSDNDTDYRRHLAAVEDGEEEKGQLEAKLGGEKEEVSLTPPPQQRLPDQNASHPPHKTVTFNPQETPLVFSRHSSFESLNSFDQHSIRTGYSSCDFSRVTSGRVSPSDLPDSPGHRPPSPSKLPQQQQLQTRRTTTNGFLSAPVRHGSAVESAATVGAQSAVTQERSLLVGEKTKEGLKGKSSFEDNDDCRVKGYNEEGTPANFSSRTSLSKLTFSDDDDEDVDDEGSTIQLPQVSRKNVGPESNARPHLVNNPEPASVGDEEESDEDDELDNAILDRLKNLGMPDKKQDKPVRSIPSKPTGIPVRTSAARALLFPTPNSGSEVVSPKTSHKNIEVVSPKPNHKNLENEDDDDSTSSSDHDDLLEQCIKVAWEKPGSTNKQQFVPRPNRLGRRVEGEGVPTTLSNTSTSTAQPSQTLAPYKPTTSQNEHRHGHGIACSTSHAPVPQSRSSTGKPTLPPTASKPRPVSAIAPVPPKRQGSQLSSSASSVTGHETQTQDQVHVYAIEDTPHNFSTATSFSDLTVDEGPKSGRVSVDSQDGLIQHHLNQEQQHPQRVGVTGHLSGNRTPGRPVPASGHETPLHYATEGTPAIFSRNDSLSSLNSDDEVSGRREPHVESNRVSQNSTPGKFRSHLPRPQAVGKSESSSSSQSGTAERKKETSEPQPSPEKSQDDASDTDSNDEDFELLLAKCYISGMPKSKSEPLDLKNKSLSNLKRQTSPSQRPGQDKSPRERSKSKSPRNSRIIPGVRITELKLLSRADQQKKQQQQQEQEASDLSKRKTRTPSPDPAEPSADDNTPASMPMAVTDYEVEDSGECHDNDPHDVENVVDDDNTILTDTLTESRVIELEANKVVETVAEHQREQQQSHYRFAMARKNLISSDESTSMMSSVCSTLSMIQPPSMMDNLVSMTGSPEKTLKSQTPRIECRHTISAKKGYVVPEMVRRALGVSSNLNATSFEDMSSSLSSCQSNLDNIRPPTIMDDLELDNSILSIASISSELAEGEGKMGTSGESNKTESRMIDLNDVSIAEMTEINDILPPSAMDEVSGVLSSRTLVADAPVLPGATYTVEPAANAFCDADQSTYQDLTDVFDDSIEPTLTLGSDCVDELPDLPRDSRRTTPAQSREGSRESTPRTQRKIGAQISTCSLMEREKEMERLRNFKAEIPSLDESISSDLTSGYKSGDVLNSSPKRDIDSSSVEASPRSSRQRRKDDIDRFKTHTITRDDLVQSSSPEHSPTVNRLAQNCSSSDSSPRRSPRSVKQRRIDEPDRFKTHTIRSADIRGEESEDKKESEQFDALLEANAQLVVDAISEGKGRSRSASVDMLTSMEERERSKARSASIEILDDSIMDQDFDVGSCNSTLERKRLAKSVGSPKAGPGICKPGESLQQQPEAEVRAIRGRRKPLYSAANSSPKRSTVPPAVPPKPTIAPKPRKLTSAPAIVQPGRMGSPPTQIRGTRASNLRQGSSTALQNKPSPPSPKFQRSNLSSAGSTSSSSSSRSSRPMSTSPRAPSANRATPTSRPHIIREGTFTKEESHFTNVPTYSDSDGSSVVSAKTMTRPNPIRRDAVHPMPAARSPSVSSQSSKGQVRPTQTRTSALRERSKTRQNSTPNSSELQRNSSSASNSSQASYKSGMKPSSSIQSFRSADITTNTTPPKRAPSSSEIEHKRALPFTQHHQPAAKPPIAVHQQAQASDTQSEKSSNKKEVTSRIASLWKRVEDSKKKQPKEKDSNKVWISKGKLIPESERALIKPDEKQREIINNFQANQKAQAKTAAEPVIEQTPGMKPRSKSRLSIRLSKFSLSSASSKKDLHQKGSMTPTAPTPASNQMSFASNLKPASSTPHLTNGDRLNGNWAPATTSNLSRPRDRLTNDTARTDERPSGRHEIDDTKTKRMSRLGTFLNPTTSDEPHGTGDLLYVKPVQRTANRSPSAIVAPFNYSPPIENDSTMGNNVGQRMGLKNTASKVSSSSVKRNDSYVSSMGRVQETAAKTSQNDEVICDEHETSTTSSIVVTLV